MAQPVMLHQFCQLLFYCLLAYDVGELHGGENKSSKQEKATLYSTASLFQVILFNTITLSSISGIAALPHSSDLICDEKQQLIFHFHQEEIW